jgi:hypothetical protein
MQFYLSRSFSFCPYRLLDDDISKFFCFHSKRKKKKCEYTKERKVQKGSIFLEVRVLFYCSKSFGYTLQKEDKLFQNLCST